MTVRVEPASVLDRWNVLDEWKLEVLALPPTSPADAETMRELVTIGLLELAQRLTSLGVTLALSR